MKEIFKLAIRNLKEHKTKTIIISLFFIFGVAIVIMGNSFLESINKGLEKDFRQNYTGDIAINVVPDRGDTYDLFGVQTMNFNGDIPQIPAINELDKVTEIVQANKEIKISTKFITAQVMISDNKEMDISAFLEKDDMKFDDLPIACLFAGEESTYWQTFDGLNLIEGRLPTKDSSEVIFDTRVKNAYESMYKKTLNIGDTVTLAGVNGKLREAIVVGIFKPSNENSAMFQTIYADANFARTFADLTYASSFSDDILDNVDFSISDMSEDELFNFEEDDLFSNIDDSNSVLADSSTNFDSILGDTSLRDQLNLADAGAWQFILAKVNNPRNTQKIITQLNKEFAEQKLNVIAVNWETAAASYTQTVEGISFIFNLLIIILAVVVFIIIMNTMTVSIIERTGEIGTMRAIGAGKNFVRMLFYTETVSITILSSIIGIIFSLICMAIFNSLNITITNSIAKMILGGGLLHFSFSPKIIITTVLVALFGSILSNLYPVSSALKITPLKALSNGE